MRLFRPTVGVSLAAALLMGTASLTAAQSAAPSGGSSLTGTDWLLTSITANGTQSAAPDGVKVTLQIDASADGALAGGSGGCNRYMATVTSLDPIKFGPVASTMMACPDPQGSFEQQYFTALETVAGGSVAGDTLTLTDASGAPVLVFQAAPAATLEGAWVVTGYNNGKEAVVSPPEGVELTADFAPDGTVSGHGGCNTFSGGYSYTDTTIAIGPLLQTMMSCGDEKDAVEHQYLSALQAATTWAMEGDALVLRDDKGAMQVTLARS